MIPKSSRLQSNVESIAIISNYVCFKQAFEQMSVSRFFSWVFLFVSSAALSLFLQVDIRHEDVTSRSDQTGCASFWCLHQVAA